MKIVFNDNPDGGVNLKSATALNVKCIAIDDPDIPGESPIVRTVIIPVLMSWENDGNAMRPRQVGLPAIIIDNGHVFIAHTATNFWDLCPSNSLSPDIIHCTMDRLKAVLKENGVNNEALEYIEDLVKASNPIKAQLDDLTVVNDYIDKAKEVLPVSIPNEIDALVKKSMDNISKRTE